MKKLLTIVVTLLIITLTVISTSAQLQQQIYQIDSSEKSVANPTQRQSIKPGSILGVWGFERIGPIEGEFKLLQNPFQNNLLTGKISYYNQSTAYFIHLEINQTMATLSGYIVDNEDFVDFIGGYFIVNNTMIGTWATMTNYGWFEGTIF